MEQDIANLIGRSFYFLITIGIGVIGYFLKDIMKKIDDLSKSVHDVEITTHEIKKDYVTDTIHQKEMEMVKRQLREVEKDYITKEDFYREQSKTEKKLDMILDELMKRK